MSILLKVSSLAVQQLMRGALSAIGIKAGNEGADSASKFLAQRFGDASAHLINALVQANGQAWQALEVALAGDSLWERCRLLGAGGDVREFRRQVQPLFLLTGLETSPDATAAFRLDCLAELRRARKNKQLTQGALAPEELARAAGAFARFADPKSLLEAEWRAVENLADDLRSLGYLSLARFVALRGQGPPLLAVAARYFFRRQVETNQELARGLGWAQMDALIHSQETAFRSLEEWLLQLGPQLDRLHDLGTEALETAREIHLEQLQQSARLEEVHRAVLKLTASREGAALAPKLAAADVHRSAESFHKGYLACLRQRDWQTALTLLLQAARLHPERFAPFPMDKLYPLRLLGAGAFGAAFLCRHVNLDRLVVVKALHPDSLARDVLEVFREAQILGFLDHPAVVRVLDCDFCDAARMRPYLVMDYFPGVSLEEHVRHEGPLPPTDVLAVARPAAEALRVAHGRDIWHRDVKPGNILVRRGSSGWEVKLIDFGLAVRQEQRSGELRVLPAEYAVAGSLEYGAPEQLGRLPGVAIGPHSDVYGFGRTCCYALVGTADPGSGGAGKLDAAWRTLLDQCTAMDVERRLPDFDAVLERLDFLAARLSQSAQPSYHGWSPLI